jgi:S-adenosylmethionine/arginine decarboxylase-like enzyme
MDEIREKYDKNKSWGISASVDLHSCKPESIRDAEKINEFVVKICDLIKVNRFGECTVVDFGTSEEVQGFSIVQLIDTSLVSGHFANKTNNVYLDIFSCKYFNPKEVAEFCKDFFQAENYTLNYTFRK